MELYGSGVRVVTLVPGYIATPMTAVNTYPMPFMLDADTAAQRMARVIAVGLVRSGAVTIAGASRTSDVCLDRAACHDGTDRDRGV